MRIRSCQEDVQAFLLIKNDCIMIKSEDNSIYQEGVSLHQISSLKNIFSLLRFNDRYVIIRDDLNRSILFDLKIMIEIPFEIPDFRALDVFDNYILFYQKKPVRTQGVFNFLTQSIVICSEKTDLGECILKDKIIRTLPDKMQVQDLDTGSYWQFSLSTLPSYKDIWGKEKPAEVIQILGIYENVLWVHIANFRLIGIDVKNGELLHYFDNLLKGKSENVFLDELLGRIKILSYDYYGEFDLKTLSFIKEETVQCIDDVKIRASNFIKGDKNLYFCGYYNQSLHPNAFGIFDTEKVEIVWYETTNDDLGYFYNPPQASEKLLAILDDKQNLLIYERD